MHSLGMKVGRGRYFASLPANKLELWFALEAERFQACAAPKHALLPHVLSKNSVLPLQQMISTGLPTSLWCV